MKAKCYCGVADAHGVDSFVRFDKCPDEQLFMMVMRAGANRQRHAVAYKVWLTKSAVDTIQTFLKKKDWVQGLILIKQFAVKTELGAAPAGGLEKSWDMIPDSKLDPFHSS
jgi:hypothetical protein